MMRKVALIGAVGGTLYGGLAAGLMYQSSNEKAEVEKGDAKDKVFIVTGANSGIGREIAHQLARERGKVIMACRDMSKCEEERQKIVLDTRNKYVYCRQCDLASFQSIKDFVAQFNKQEEKCDALINNAGIMKCRKMHTQDGIELQLGTNHMGPYLLSHLLRPRLKNSGQGRLSAKSSIPLSHMHWFQNIQIDSFLPRIVYLTNLDYRQGLINFEDLNSDRSYDPATAFYQSQLANILAVQSLSKEFLEDKIMVYAAYPGLCDTQIERHTGLNKSISGSLVANNLLWFMHRFTKCILKSLNFNLIQGHLRKEQQPPSTVLLPPPWQTPLVSSSRGSRRRKLKLLLQIRSSMNAFPDIFTICLRFW